MSVDGIMELISEIIGNCINGISLTGTLCYAWTAVPLPTNNLDVQGGRWKSVFTQTMALVCVSVCVCLDNEFQSWQVDTVYAQTRDYLQEDQKLRDLELCKLFIYLPALKLHQFSKRETFQLKRTHSRRIIQQAPPTRWVCVIKLQHERWITVSGIKVALWVIFNVKTARFARCGSNDLCPVHLYVFIT